MEYIKQRRQLTQLNIKEFLEQLIYNYTISSEGWQLDN
jgi:hypothetical protein